MNRHIIVLNLDRSPERKILLEKQFKNIGISDYTFFPAYDGKKILNMGMGKVPILKGAGRGRNLLITEIAVIMSHLGALKHAQIMGYDDVIILEDDVVICEDWEHRLDILHKSLPENWEYVYLAGHSDYVKLPKHDKPTIMKAPPMIGAFSYLVNKIGIQKLINYCSEFTTTYDDMIMHKIQKEKLNGYIYFPFMVYHDGKESLIWSETPGHLSHKNQKHSSFTYFKNKI